MIGADALARMKPTATLVNVGRGALVDIEALRGALASGGIAQAFVDVLPREPLPADSDLWDIPNLFISPHAACMTPLYTVRVGEIWLENLKRFLAGEELIHRAFYGTGPAIRGFAATQGEGKQFASSSRYRDGLAQLSKSCLTIRHANGSRRANSSGISDASRTKP